MNNLKRAYDFREAMANIMSFRGRSHAVAFRHQREKLTALMKQYGDVPAFKKDIVDHYKEIPD